MEGTNLDNIKTLALGLLLLLAMATAQTICYELDETSERVASSNQTTSIEEAAK